MKKKQEEEAPDPGEVAGLIAARHDIAGVRVELHGDRSTPGLSVILDRGKNRYRLEVAYRRGAGDKEKWPIVADAADALVGMLVESDWAYRDLPQGGDVEFDGVTFEVSIERSVPALDAEADRLLAEWSKKS